MQPIPHEDLGPSPDTILVVAGATVDLSDALLVPLTGGPASFNASFTVATAQYGTVTPTDPTGTFYGGYPWAPVWYTVHGIDYTAPATIG